MRVFRIISVVLLVGLLSPAASAQLNFNWTHEPGGFGDMSLASGSRLRLDGTIAAAVGGVPCTAVWAGPPAPNHNFTRTALGLPAGYSEMGSISGINSNGYFAVGKQSLAGDPDLGAWAYTSVGWTDLVVPAGVKHTATDQNEDHAIVNARGGGWWEVKTVDLTVAGAATAVSLPNQIAGEPDFGRISESGEYISHYDNSGNNGSQINYGANWSTVRSIPITMERATDVNNSGNAVGFTGNNAYFYDFSSNTVSQIPLGSGWAANWDKIRPFSMNNFDKVVGVIYDSSNDKKKGLFYYDYSTNTTVDLNDIVDDEPPPGFSPSSGDVHIGEINDTGWITGAVFGNTPDPGGDTQCGFLLTTAGPLHNPGDVNNDKFVGGADLTKIIDNWGMSPADWADGDIDPFDAGDDFIGGADYTQVLNNWGTSYAPEAVPEPATLGLLLVGGLLGLSRRSGP